jgi:RimJ/RimL family protein N-acetyltransferase
MTTRTNHLGQPIGAPLPGWKSAQLPPRTPMQGRYCRVEPLAEAHGDDLYAAFREDAEGRNWTYNPDGPFETREAFGTWLAAHCAGAGRLPHAIVDLRDGRAAGIASYMRMEPAVGSPSTSPRGCSAPAWPPRRCT